MTHIQQEQPPQLLQPRPRRARGKRSTTRPTGKDVITFIEEHCYVPEGKFLGKLVTLAPWQKKIIHEIYDKDTRRAIISFGRKNGKTSLAAFLLLTHLSGPAARRNSQLYSTAQSREQAAQVFGLAAKIVRLSPDLQPRIRIREANKELFDFEMGARYRALSAETKTTYGLSPTFVVHDEIGVVQGPRSPLYDAVETATGGQEDPLSVIISTQARTDADLFSILIDDALAGYDPRTFVSLHTAPVDADPFTRETIAKANPALGNFLNEKEVFDMAGVAQRMPARENEYRNLILNQRVESRSPFVSPILWKSCGTSPGDIEGATPVYAGLDLSEVRDLTALVIIGRIDDVWSVKPTFWLPEKGLADKARADRVPYDQWAKEGHLLTAPGASVSYEYVAQYLRKIFDTHNVQKVGFDRWHFVHLKPYLQQQGFSEEALEEKFVDFGQGTKSMSPALRDLEHLILNQKLAHGNHPVLSMCAANAVVEGQDKDLGKDSSNRKLSKKRSSGRIDGMVALAMAVGVAPLQKRPIDISTMIV